MTRWILCVLLASGCAAVHVTSDAQAGDAAPGSLGLGDPCATDADCHGDLTCATIVRGADACSGEITFPGGYCTRVYTSDSDDDCPSELLTVALGTCASSLPTTLVCLAHCDVDADCRTSEGYHCEAAFTGEGGCTAD